ncbi:MAG: RecQ family ATP-dependent DNA helicase [Pirellulales bacterium]|nr:RecQ family ATP-dependent DNA helicase [Pirellulales bacterium]
MSDLAQIQDLMRQYFGYGEFRPGQREVFECLLAGKSAAAVFPTGGGKSLCYQLPALTFPGLTLVVSPLIALMKDQIDALRKRRIPARRLDSTLNLAEYRDAMSMLRSGELKMLYVAPERLLNERFCETLLQAKISLFAVDEAHCISEWGHNFRPDYLRLASFAKACRAERVLALTATATAPVLADICKNFEIAADCAIRTGFYRPNLTLLATEIDREARERDLIARLRDRPAGPTIIYVTLQRTAEELAEKLTAAGLSAQAYHAGLEDGDRARIQDWFIRGTHEIVVATIAFGMGIDKADIRYVYHYNPPKSLENYAQEIGRAGRDGQSAICEFLFVRSDLFVLENFVYGDTPTAANVRGFVDELWKHGGEFSVSQYDLSSKFNIRINVVRTLLTYLELAGHLSGGTPYYDSYQIKPRVPSGKILANFDGERREFLTKLFGQFVKKKIWLQLDLEQACKNLRQSRERIIRALDYLAEQQYLELKTAGLRHRYKTVGPRPDLAKLANTLYKRLKDRETRELERLQGVVDWVEHRGCQVRALGTHFAETETVDCGHCTWCLDRERPRAANTLAAPQIADQLWRQALAARRAGGTALADPHTFACFLCGLPAPLFTRQKLTTQPGYGLLAEVPFATVLEKVQAVGAA